MECVGGDVWRHEFGAEDKPSAGGRDLKLF